MDTAVFTLSLDLELLWGHKPPHLHHLITRNPPQLRHTIHTILTLLDHYQIPATWATVGHLFYDHCTPDTCPTTINRTTHHYTPDWYTDPHTNITQDPLYYGPDLIQAILDHNIHEIGYHSFSHPDFTTITPTMAANELTAIHHIQQTWPIHFKSFVFPYNHINHLDLLPTYGFTAYRSPTHHYTTNAPPLTRKWQGLTDKITTPLSLPRPTHNHLWNIPATMYFCDPQLPPSVPFRATHALHKAIKTKTLFHAWLHPWSLLLYPRLTHDLDQLLHHTATHINNGDIEALTMGAYADRLQTTLHTRGPP